MMQNKKTTFLLSTLFLLWAGCGEVVPVDGSAVDAAPGTEVDAMVSVGACEGDSVAIDDLLDCFIAAQCEWLVNCLAFAPTVDACIEQVNQEGGLDLGRTLESVAAQRTIYDGVAAANCLATIDATSCGEQPGENCSDVFVGTIPEDGLCYERDECSGVDADCRHDSCQDQCCAGSCLDAAPLGGDCSDRPCHEGDECVRVDGTVPESQCYSGEQGIACIGDSDCDSGLYCGPSLYCVPGLVANANCNQNSQCADPLTCVGESNDAGVCLAVDSVGAICDTGCDGNLFCNRDQGSPTGTCAMPQGMNAACVADSHCQPHLFCSDADRMCKVRPMLGMPCENNSCGPGLFCTSELPGMSTIPGTCAAPRAATSSCNSDSHCTSRICNYGTNLCEDYVSCYL